jgi:hypothetical protein
MRGQPAGENEQHGAHSTGPGQPEVQLELEAVSSLGMLLAARWDRSAGEGLLQQVGIMEAKARAGRGCAAG